MNGVLNVYKEKGYTSHDVVAKLRGICHQKKIGHTGTLDPEAEGVLPVCLGNATKLCDFLTDKSKVYEAVLLLGKTSDTYDAAGVITSEQSTDGINSEEITNVIKSFEPGYEQIPPMYSAKKINGQKLYDLARAGKEVERKAVSVSIPLIEILEINLPRVRMRVHCGKGTYIRSLCHDIGAKVGCGALMEELLRIRVSNFYIEQSMRLSEIQDLMDQGQLEEKLMPTDEVLYEYPEVHTTRDADRFLANGNMFPGKWASKSVENGTVVRVYNSECYFIGLFRYDGSRNMFMPVKMFPG